MNKSNPQTTNNPNSVGLGTYNSKIPSSELWLKPGSSIPSAGPDGSRAPWEETSQWDQ